MGLLKPKSPLLVYLYYSFDNRPLWFRLIWKISDIIRRVIFRFPPFLKHTVTDLIAVFVYFPLSVVSKLLYKLNINVEKIPLSFYKDHSFYTMRTDARDRFGTPLEQRFTKSEIKKMMEEAGLEKIKFSDHAPYWCAVGYKKRKALSSGLFLKQNEILSQKIIFINDMCGFAGLININNYSRNEMARIVKSMGDEIAHRGPDDSGEWIDESSKIAFAHRRLSILDLSKAGHQPMFSSSNRYILVFNGEIYNHLEIRKEIEKNVKKIFYGLGILIQKHFCILLKSLVFIKLYKNFQGCLQLLFGIRN